MATPREREVLVEFIELYKDMPCLWDLSSDFYKDKNQRKVAWEMLVEKLKNIDPNANEISAKKKVDHLKYAYQRELKKVKESKRKRSATGEKLVYRPSLWYYDLMTFLDNKNQTQGSGGDSLIEEDEVESKKRKKIETKDEIFEKKKDKLFETAPLLRTFIKDSQTNAFGAYVGQKLEQVEPGQREIAEKLISDVLFLAKTNNLRFNSRIDTPYVNPLPQYSSENSNSNTHQSPPYNQSSNSQIAQPTTSSSYFLNIDPLSRSPPQVEIECIKTEM